METFIKDTNREVCEAYSRDGKPGAGATLVFLAVLNDRAFWCSAGDSRLYLLRRGKLYQMNEDHDYKNQLLGRYIERDGTTLEQAFGDAQGSALASYMGCPGMTTYECSVRGLPLQNRDCFLLMSDGVYRALTEQDLLKREGESPQKMCEHLIGDAEAKQMPGQDNMTLLAVEYQWRSLCTRNRGEGGRKMRKNIKKLFALMTALFLAAGTLLWGETAKAASPTEAKDSVVCIGVGDAYGNLIGWGTGFAVGEPGEPIQYIVTNAHVAEPTDEDGNYIPCSLTVYFSAAANRSMMAEVYWCDQTADLAILKLPEETTEREALVLCPMEDVDMDDEFAALGYPATSMASDFVKFDTTDISITRGGISKQVRVSGRDCYLLDIQISQGNSGGPLVNSEGEVVGVNTFMLNDEARYAVAIDELIRDVSQDEVPMCWRESRSCLVFCDRGRCSSGCSAGGRNRGGQEQQGKDGRSEGRIGIRSPTDTAAWSMAGDHSDAPADPVQKQAPPAPDARFVIVAGSASPLAGKSYPAGREQTIGRDGSRCDIVFPVETKGVSAKHCKISPAEEGIVLSDLGSTYGTFLANGTKVEPGQKRMLRLGDAFYLGGEDNRFEVR